MKNSIQNLKKQLEVVGSICSYNYDIVRKIQDYIAENPKSVISKKWLTEKYLKNWQDMNLKAEDFDITCEKYWQTYNRYRNAKFSIVNSQVVVTVKVSYYTNEMDCDDKLYKNHYDRFTATIKVPDSYLNLIEDYFKSALELHFSDEYEKLLKEQKQNWINSQIKSLNNERF